MEELIKKIPIEVSRVTKTLENRGFLAYIVGGCVRDLVMGKEPKDWDVATSAKPDEIIKIFPETFYDNLFGTVGVVNKNVSHETLKVIEVTPFRKEGIYKDFRHPDGVEFGISLDDDLKRRDFTVNAMALDNKGQIKDIFKGQEDLKDKIIRAVGNPNERFNEDALRILRAVRLATELYFTIEHKTAEAIREQGALLKHISQERVRDEFSKIIMTPNPMQGIILANKLRILQYIFPETEEGIGVKQNGDHIYDVWEHSLRALQHSADRNWPLHVRLAAFLHDVSKPETRRWSDEKNDWTFYGHDVVGGRVSARALTRLRYSKKEIETVSKLVRYHLFFSDIEKITLSAVRRIVKNVGSENVWDLMKVRACDRIGMGRPKETPYRLRKYESMIEEAMRSPVSVAMLKIDGARIMEVTSEKPGPKIGFILHALLEEVLEDPKFNTEEYLEKRAQELMLLPEEELKRLGEEGKGKKEEKEAKEIAEIRKRHWVK